MTATRNSYETVVFSNGLASLLYTLNCDSKSMDIMLVDRTVESRSRVRDIELYPYELPVFGLSKFKVNYRGFKSIFSELDAPLGVVFGASRFEYFKTCIKDEIKREFPDCQNEFMSFLEDILAMDSKPKKLFDLSGSSKKDINYFYEKHKLPLKVRAILDSIIFMFSGVKDRNFPAAKAIRILASALNGVSIPKDGVYSLRSEILRGLPKSIEIENNSSEVCVSKRSKRFNIVFSNNKDEVTANFAVSDCDQTKAQFIKDFHDLKSDQSAQVLYPYSIYVKIPVEAVPGCMNRWTLLVDTDRSSLLNYDDVYAVRMFINGRSAIIRVTTFVSYGAFEIDNSIHRNKASKMYDALKKMIPVADKFEPEIYPDFNSDEFETELYQLFDNIGQGDVVYTGIPVKIKNDKECNGVFCCGREGDPYMGFEGMMNNSMRELQ